MKEWYNDFIGVYENAFPKDLCNQIIDLMNSTELHKRPPTEGTSLHKKDLINNLKFINKELSSLVETFLLQNILPLYSKQYPMFDEIGPYYIPIFKFQKTLPAGGYHVWHCENNSWENRHRVGVYTIYLNDLEEGGETEFLYQSIRIKPSQGTVCIFPAGYTHIHRGNPPLSGEKYILTGWVDYVDPKLLENQNLN